MADRQLNRRSVYETQQDWMRSLRGGGPPKPSPRQVRQNDNLLKPGLSYIMQNRPMSPRKHIPCKANQLKESAAGTKIYDSIAHTTPRKAKTPRFTRAKTTPSMVTAGVPTLPKPGRVRVTQQADGSKDFVCAEDFYSPMKRRVQYPLPDDSSRAGMTIRNERRKESRPSTARSEGPPTGVEQVWSPSRKRAAHGRSLEATSSELYSALGQNPCSKAAAPYVQGGPCAPHHRAQARGQSATATKVTMFSRGKSQSMTSLTESKEGAFPVVDKKVRANNTTRQITDSRVLLEHNSNTSSADPRRIRHTPKKTTQMTFERSQSLNVLMSHSYGPGIGGNFKSPTKRAQQAAYKQAFSQSMQSNNDNRRLYEKLRQRER